MQRFLYNAPYIHGPGAIKWIVACWEQGSVRCGYEFHVARDARNFDALVAELSPRIIYCDIVSTPIEDAGVRATLQRARSAGAKVCLSVFWPLFGQPEARADALRRYDLADLYCGEREPESMTAFESECRKVYVTMPQSANPRFHFPTAPVERYRYDVAFLGAKLPLKRWFNENVIAPLRRGRFRLGLFGPCWTLQDNTLRAASKAAKMTGATGIARLVDRLRISVPEEDENKLYSSARISLNFHEREPDNTQPHYLVNQRTFKIAACGGFQIVDPIPALSRYFETDEIVQAGLDGREWLDKITYFLSHEEERRGIQERATARALGHHMAHHRVRLLEKLLGLDAARQP